MAYHLHGNAFWSPCHGGRAAIVVERVAVISPQLASVLGDKMNMVTASTPMIILPFPRVATQDGLFAALAAQAVIAEHVAVLTHVLLPSSELSCQW
jgi:hypothetical protein